MRLALVVVLAGCAMHAHVADRPIVASECASPPAGAVRGFRHVRSNLIAALGRSRHRGDDVIALAGEQRVTGKLAFTSLDKALEDEDVEVSACIGGAWQPVGTARTGSDGRFAVDVHLPPGTRDLYVRAPGDGSGARFLAFVAPADTRVIVCDVDGTLTRSEHAVLDTIIGGDDIASQPEAAHALAAAGYPIVYVTARGDQLAGVTRRWLGAHGFPLGPIRLAHSAITTTGAATVAYKARVLSQLPFAIAAGIGNRASDISAYARAGVAPDHILILDREYAGELRAPLAAGRATGFASYDQLDRLLR
jgi:hypothetical protein